MSLVPRGPGHSELDGVTGEVQVHDPAVVAGEIARIFHRKGSRAREAVEHIGNGSGELLIRLTEVTETPGSEFPVGNSLLDQVLILQGRLALESIQGRIRRAGNLLRREGREYHRRGLVQGRDDPVGIRGGVEQVLRPGNGAAIDLDPRDGAVVERPFLVRKLAEDKEQLGHCIGKEFRASLAVLEEQFAKAVQKKLMEVVKLK